MRVYRREKTFRKEISNCLCLFKISLLILPLVLVGCVKEETIPSKKPFINSYIINTRPATSISIDSCQLNAEILRLGESEIFETGFLVSVDPAPNFENSKKIQHNVKKAGPCSVVVKNLEANSLYYYTFYLKNSKNEVQFGKINAFSTKAPTILSVDFGENGEDLSRGYVVTIVGVGFSKIASENTVKFNDIPAQLSQYHYDSYSGNSSFTTRVPDDLEKGEITLSIVRGRHHVVYDKTLNLLPGVWKKIKDFPGAGRYNAPAFTVGNNGYVGWGKSSFSDHNNLFEYSPESNTWREVLDVQTDHSPTHHFSVGNRHFFLSIHYDWETSTFVKKFFEYVPSSNTIIPKNDFPGKNLYGFMCFNINGRGFVGGGGYYENDTHIHSKVFWEYNPLTDEWYRISHFPGTSAINTSFFTIDNKVYFTLANYENSYLTDLWEYNSENNKWSIKSKFPGFNSSGTKGFSLNGKGYIVGGTNRQNHWEYNPSTDQWTKISSPPERIGNNPSSFVLNGKAYIGLGDFYTNTFWEFTPEN